MELTQVARNGSQSSQGSGSAGKRHLFLQTYDYIKNLHLFLRVVFILVVKDVFV